MNSVGNLTASGQSRVHVGNHYHTTIHSNSDSSRSSCLADLRLTDPRDDKTRIEQTKGGLLRDSYRWIFENSDFQKWRDKRSKNLIWIRGDAGKGKTMLLCGIINELLYSNLETGRNATINKASRKLAHQLKKLRPSSAAGKVYYFFCQGTDSRLNHATAVLRGLMYLLLLQQPTLISYIQTAYDHVGRQAFEGENSMYTLLRALADMLRDNRAKGCYMVIDALDECQTDLHPLLDFISQTASTIKHFKWIVSSRNRPDIEKYLQSDGSDAISLELNALHVAQSINIFIEYKVSRLASLKGKESLQTDIKAKLQEKANGTFLWVALVVQRLQMVHSWDLLDVVESTPAGLLPLYDRMLEDIRKLPKRDNKLCCLAISTVAAAYRPLHIRELGVLCDGPAAMSDDAQFIEEMVDMCGSFLTVREKTVYLIHQSVRDYIFSEGSSTIFPLGITATHRTMATRSLESMSRTLRQDICNLRHPGVHVDEIKSVKPDPLAAVRYSCTHWVDHLANAQSGQDLPNSDGVHTFLEGHYLHWLESLSIMHKMPEGVSSLTKLLRLAQAESKTSQLTKLTQDGLRFSKSFKVCIEGFPLQVYVSALVFSPRRSIVRHSNRQREPRWVSAQPPAPDEWSACVHTMEGHEYSVKDVAFSPDGTQIASASTDNTAKLWDAETGRCLLTFTGHGNFLTSAVFSSDGSKIASSSFDMTVRLWDVVTGRCVHTFAGHTDRVSSVVFAPDGTKIASGSDDTTVKLWNVVNGSCLHTLAGHSQIIRSVVFSPDGTRIASGSNDKTARLWDAGTGRCLNIFSGHFFPVRSLSFLPCGTKIVLGSDEFTVKLWDIATGQCIAALQDLETQTRSLLFSRSGAKVALQSGDQRIPEVMDIVTNRTWMSDAHLSWYESIAFSCDESQLAGLAVHPSHAITLWSIATNQTRTLEGHTMPVRSVVFSSDGLHIASASDDGTVKLWDVALGEGRAEQTPEAHSSWINSIVFSPDRTQVVTASHDKSFKLWHVATGQARTFLGHTDSVTSAVFSPDGLQIASTSQDKTVKLWDLATGAVVTLEGHTLTVTSVAYSPDGTQVASASHDGTLRIWDTATGKPLRNTLVGRAVSEYTLRSSFGLGMTMLSPSPSVPCQYDISDDRMWVTKGSDKLLWLPLEYRPGAYAFQDSMVAIGARSGRVLILRFGLRLPQDLVRE